VVRSRLWSGLKGRARGCGGTVRDVMADCGGGRSKRRGEERKVGLGGGGKVRRGWIEGIVARVFVPRRGCAFSMAEFALAGCEGMEELEAGHRDVV
jgi:hypothetical protein